MNVDKYEYQIEMFYIIYVQLALNSLKTSWAMHYTASIKKHPNIQEMHR